MVVEYLELGRAFDEGLGGHSGVWRMVNVEFCVDGRWSGIVWYRLVTPDEDEATEKLLDAFLEETDSEHLRAKCEEGFRYLRQFNVDGHRSLILLPHTQLEPHFTCRMGSSEQKESLLVEEFSDKNQITKEKESALEEESSKRIESLAEKKPSEEKEFSEQLESLQIKETSKNNKTLQSYRHYCQVF